MKIVSISPFREDVKELIAASDSLLNERYPSESNHLDDINTLSAPNVHFMGCLDKDRLAGICAVKILSDDGIYGEMKRLFVIPEMRGRGLAKKLIESLEDHLKEQNISIIRLETGIYQEEAMGLLAKLGYTERTPFGKYKPDPYSVFMEKRV